MKHIICFHLFNDYSGSPQVLKIVLEGLLKKGYQIDLITSTGGALDELLYYKNLSKYSYPYRFSNNPIVTMLRHYHENAFVKGTFYKVLATIMQKLAHEIICVSEYQASFLQQKKCVITIPNALPQNFVNRLTPNFKIAFERKTILMLGSLKLYKSPLEFIELAKRLPQFVFVLVISDTKENIDIFIEKYKINVYKNLTIYPRQNDVVPFYNQASLVLNLSDKKQVVETFGLTALEAMSAGLPVIVPTEGGIAEMVVDGENGYKIDVQNLNQIAECIKTILSDETLYMELAQNALAYSKRFSEAKMVNSIEMILNRK